MHFTFENSAQCLRATLYGRNTVEETVQFIEALAAAAREHSAKCILICVRSSRPIFKVEQYKISGFFKQLAANNVRVALLADSDEVRAAHQYIEVLAAQQGAAVRAFREESRALAWLQSQEKR
jgi:hypothetical protein